jgi:hypothetical protein
MGTTNKEVLGANEVEGTKTKGRREMREGRDVARRRTV